MKYLLQRGEDINAETLIRHNTPLILAAIYQQTHIVQLLLESAADPYLKNIDGKMAVDYAAELNNNTLV